MSGCFTRYQQVDRDCDPEHYCNLAAQWRVEVLARVEAGKHDGDRRSIPCSGRLEAALGFEIGFGARHKEAARLKPLEVDISSVHDVEGPTATR